MKREDVGSQKFGHYIRILCTGWFILNGIVKLKAKNILLPALEKPEILVWICFYFEGENNFLEMTIMY